MLTKPWLGMIERNFRFQSRVYNFADMTDKEMLEASNPPFSCSFCPGRSYSSKKTLAEHHRKIHQGGVHPAKEVAVTPIELKEAPPGCNYFSDFYTVSISLLRTMCGLCIVG